MYPRSENVKYNIIIYASKKKKITTISRHIFGMCKTCLYLCVVNQSFIYKNIYIYIITSKIE